jgi:ferrous-iron efflux pump FieF
MLFAIAATLVLLGVQHHVIRQTGSTAIRADALHYATDLATNTATVIALTLAHFGWPGLDPFFALGIAVYILYSAQQIARDALQLLMDRELPESERQRLVEIARSTPGVLGVHGLRTRQSGQTKVIQLHLELADDLPLREAHQISTSAEAKLREDFPHADIVIHQDPAIVGDEGQG